VLAHYYVPLEVQDIADIVGDSFEMAKTRQGSRREADRCLRRPFYGRKRQILSPDKKVLIPSASGLPDGGHGHGDDVLRLRAEHPDAAVMC
jgi:quinolinate synthase